MISGLEATIRDKVATLLGGEDHDHLYYGGLCSEVEADVDIYDFGGGGDTD